MVSVMMIRGILVVVIETRRVGGEIDSVGVGEDAGVDEVTGSLGAGGDTISDCYLAKRTRSTSPSSTKMDLLNPIIVDLGRTVHHYIWPNRFKASYHTRCNVHLNTYTTRILQPPAWTSHHKSTRNWKNVLRGEQHVTEIGKT